MLSTKEIKNTQQASHYFLQKDNYYTREEGIQKSEWYGKGASTLQLTGEIDSEQFNALLEGRLPTGQQLGKKVDGDIQHRAGWDLTFTAPKSVSLLALLGGDTRLLEAHRQAVKVALSDIERGCSQARLKKPTGMIFQNTQNMVASLFHHDLSRAQDPQLHTHCVVFNMTQRTDGHWRSHASQLGNYGEQAQATVNGFIERLRHHKRYYGQLYRNELAYQIKQLGYEIVVDRATGFFEIAGISREVIDRFSQRRRDIVTHLEEQDFAGGKASALATLKTRETKKIIERETLAHQWEQRAQSLGFDCKKIIENSVSVPFADNVYLPTQPNQEEHTAHLALQQATQELSRFQSTFTLEAVITLAAQYSLHHTVRTEILLTTLKSFVSSGELIELPNDQHKTVFMAKTTLDAEQRLLACVF